LLDRLLPSRVELGKIEPASTNVFVGQLCLAWSKKPPVGWRMGDNCSPLPYSRYRLFHAPVCENTCDRLTHLFVWSCLVWSRCPAVLHKIPVVADNGMEQISQGNADAPTTHVEAGSDPARRSGVGLDGGACRCRRSTSYGNGSPATP
jgi:hypothetical protein